MVAHTCQGAGTLSTMRPMMLVFWLVIHLKSVS